jgi:peptidoglycan/LPS O-acetylase OafA/YrhL
MKRLICLDGLRGVLACYVMLSHTLPFVPLPRWLHWLFQHGGAGVDVFFILSGLVIMQSLASSRYQAAPFLMARVARIYPVFLVTFAFAVAIQPLEAGFERMAWIGPDSQAHYIWSEGWPSNWEIGIAAHLTMTHGLFPNGTLPDVWVGFLGAAWSLSTEWQFYVIALLFGQRLGLLRMAWLFLALAATATLWQALGPDAWQFSRAFLPNKAQYFALGIMSAVVVQQRHKRAGSYTALLVTMLMLCVLQGGIDKLLPPLLWTLCLGAQLQTSSFMAKREPRGLILTVTHLVARVLQSRPLVWLGAVSYCIYLVNEPVQKLLGVTLAALVQGDATLFTALWVPGALVLPIVASWWLHRWIELPAQRYGRSVASATVSAA